MLSISDLTMSVFWNGTAIIVLFGLILAGVGELLLRVREREGKPASRALSPYRIMLQHKTRPHSHL